MNINQKIEAILLSCKVGVPKTKIDIKAKGNSVRQLIKDPSRVNSELFYML